LHYAASAGDVGRLMRLFHRTIEAVARAQESDGNAFEVVEEVVGWARWLRVRSEVEGLANLMPRVRITELLHEVNCVTGIASAFTNLTTGERFDDANALLAATPQGRPHLRHCRRNARGALSRFRLCSRSSEPDLPMLRSHRLRSFDQSRAYKWQDYRPAHRTVGEDARIARGQDHEDRRRNPD
jgi:hypothetical protein